MRHRKKTVKLGRTSAHRNELLANQVCALIERKRIKTTLPKAKATRSLAEKMVTLGKKGTLASRRQALSVLKQPAAVRELFAEIAPGFAGRPGGYTRIVKLGRRISDGSEMALLEWVEFGFEPAAVTQSAPEPVEEVAPVEEVPVAEAPAEEDAPAEADTEED